MLVDGDFPNGSAAWSGLGDSANITGNQLVIDDSVFGNGPAFVSQNVALVEGLPYPTSFTLVSRSASSVRIEVGGTLGTLRTVPGTYEETITAGATDVVRFRYGSEAVLTVDDAFVYEPEVTLNELTWGGGSNPAISETTGPGGGVDNLSGISSGSTLAVIDDAGGRFALSGNSVITGATPLDYETATSHEITVRETNPYGANSPRDTVLTITVVDDAD